MREKAEAYNVKLKCEQEESCTGVNITKQLNQQGQCQLALEWFKDAPEGPLGREGAKFAGSVMLDVA